MVEEGLLVRQRIAFVKDRFLFLHDSIRQACYSHWPAARREIVNLFIGSTRLRSLFPALFSEQLSTRDLDEFAQFVTSPESQQLDANEIFDSVNRINTGRAHLAELRACRNISLTHATIVALNYLSSHLAFGQVGLLVVHALISKCVCVCVCVCVSVCFRLPVDLVCASRVANLRSGSIAVCMSVSVCLCPLPVSCVFFFSFWFYLVSPKRYDAPW
jgi:hypothetical protein